MTVKAFGDTARVSVLPDCDVCAEKTLATYDARIWNGSWAYVCEYHFAMGKCELGLGKGQKLILDFLEQIEPCDYCKNPEEFSKQLPEWAWMCGCTCTK